MNSEYKIFIDLDGVIADFDGKMREITNGESDDPNYPKGKFWKTVYQYNQDVEPFFESLPKMSGADELIKFITNNFENVAFLTATGTTPKDAPQQKKNWIETNYPGIPAITVTNSAQKAIYANPRAILIDDREKSIGPWRKAGGVGILFKNNNQALSELEPFLK